MTLEDALALAARAHAGQKDKSGRPYFEHSVRVMESLRRERARAAEALGRAELLDGEDARDELIAAVLHDVVEDTPVTLDDLCEIGCPPRAVRAVDALTRRGAETYLQFVARAAADPIARRVKRADMEDNAAESRLAGLEPSVAARLRARYASGLAELAEWERYWAVVDSQKGQPGGHFQYFIQGRGLARQWRWRETGRELRFAWPELIDESTGGFWKPSDENEVKGAEIPLDRALREARAVGVELNAPRIREWTEGGPRVRFGAPPEVGEGPESRPQRSDGAGAWARALFGAAAGLVVAALVQRFRSAQQRKPVS